MSSSARRALKIVDVLGAADRPLGVTEIARALALPPGTVFRGLDALLRAGLAARYQASSRYVLGPTAARLRQSVIARFGIRDVCLPYLRQLASIGGETASLYVRLGWYAVRIATAPGTGEVTNTPPLGKAHILGGDYSGLAILAFLAAADIARYRAWTSSRNAQPLNADLDFILARGFALGVPEISDARAPVAFPIRGGKDVIASLAIEGPALAASSAEAPRDWREIVAHIESLVRAQPVLFENPFSHIDPDTIAL